VASFSQNTSGLPGDNDAVTVWSVKPNQHLWSAKSSITNRPPLLPNPVEDFGELAKHFRLAPDALVPGHVVSSVALNQDGTRLAIVEYGVWGWVRNAPAIGKWDPPIHL
jgi:hypothetical protein